MSKCEDCGLENPPDDHECEAYAQRIREERKKMTTQELLAEFDERIMELEKRVAWLSMYTRGASPWKKM